MLNLNEMRRIAGLPTQEEHVPAGDFDALLEGLNMAKVHVAKLSSAKDSQFQLKGDVFGIRNEHEIVEFMLEAMGVPRDGLAIRIRSGFMQYDNKTKMLFIARFKSDLPNARTAQDK